MISSIFSVPDCHTERSGRLREQFEVPAPDQPSIVTYLLLQRPVSLPDWPGYVHRIDTPEDAESLDDMSELIRRVVTTRLANVETVFTEVSAGSETIGEVVVKTGLGKKVVQRAMTALEKNGRIVRIRAKAHNQPHRFSVLTRKESDDARL